MTKTRKSMNDLMAVAAPTTSEPAARTGKAKPPARTVAKTVVQQQLVVQLPDVTVRALKQRALDGDTSVRAVLLAALKDAGFPVPAGQVVDFRKIRRA
jgi:hypothetical protein